MSKKLYYYSGKPVKVKSVGEFTGISDKALKEAAKKQRLAATKARVKARKSLVITKLDPKDLPKPTAGRGVNKLGNVTAATQSISPSAGNPARAGVGVPKGSRQTSFLKTFPADTAVDTLKAGEKPFKSGLQSKAQADKFAARSMQKYMQGVVGKKAAAKLVAKGAARLIPGVGTALLAYDAFTVLSSLPKAKKKSFDLYGSKIDDYGFKY